MITELNKHFINYITNAVQNKQFFIKCFQDVYNENCQ